jgi:hypothetical protein
MEARVFELTRKFVLLKQSKAWYDSISNGHSVKSSLSCAETAAEHAFGRAKCQFSAFLQEFPPTVANKSPLGQLTSSGCQEAVRVSQLGLKRQPGLALSRKRPRGDEANLTAKQSRIQLHCSVESHTRTLETAPSAEKVCEPAVEAALAATDQALLQKVGQCEPFFLVLDNSVACLPIARASPACEQWTGTLTVVS